MRTRIGAGRCLAAAIVLLGALLVPAENTPARTGRAAEDGHADDPNVEILKKLRNIQEKFAQSDRAYARGNFSKARDLGEEILKLEIELLGPDSIDVAGSRDFLAEVHMKLGNHDEARRQLKESIDILKRQPFMHWREIDGEQKLRDFDRRRQMTDDEITLLEECNDLESRLKKLKSERKLKAAILVAEETLKIKRQLMGEIHPDCGMSLLQLAILHAAAGNRNRAAPLYHEARRIIREALGEGHRNYAWILYSIGEFLFIEEDYAGAQSYLLEAYMLYSRTGGEGDKHFFRIADLLGTVFRKLGMPHFALVYDTSSVGKKASAIFGFSQQMSQTAAVILEKSAGSFRREGDFDRAAELMQWARFHGDVAFGSMHPQYALYLASQGELEVLMGDTAAAVRKYLKALDSFQQNITLASTYLSERGQMKLVRKMRGVLDSYLSLASHAGLSGSDVYESASRWKGTIFAQQIRMRKERRNPEMKALYLQLDIVSNRLGIHALSEPDPKDREAWTRELGQLNDHREALIRSLSNISTRGIDLAERLDLVPRDPIPRLPEKAVLIDFLEYSRSLFDSFEQGGEIPQERHLAAFVVRNDEPVALVDLGPVQPIRSSIVKWREKVCGKQDQSLRGKSLSKDVPLPNIDMSRDKTGKRLRELLWEPLADKTAGADLVLISPDGCLGFFPVAALPGLKPGRYLAEDVALVHVPAPRLLPDLLAAEPPQRTDDAKVSLFVVGGVNFEETQPEPLLASTGRDAVRGSSWKKFPYLKGSAGEIIEMKEQFSKVFPGGTVTSLEGKNALEETFREEVTKHRFIHLATHGFFAPPQLKSALAPVEGNSGNLSFHESGFDLPGCHPGLLSGIAFAGANGKQPEGLDDGIFTAVEMAATDLSKVELMVLSACQTGLGVETGGEGHIGLLRAAQLAGTRTVVASLWKVHDKKTQELMKRFYENLWKEKLSILESLRRVQLDLIAEKDPVREWAAWIISGDWR